MRRNYKTRGKMIKSSQKRNSTLLLVILSTTFVSLSFMRNLSSVIDEFRIPKIIGVSDSSSLCLSPNYMMNAWYDIERMDSITEVLDLTSPSKEHSDLVYQFSTPDSLGNLPSSNDGLSVFVDTLNELTITKQPIWARFLFHRYLGGEEEILQDDTLVTTVKSFPIYVTNLSGDKYAKLRVQDGSLMMVVQATDTSGQWKPIEYWSGSWCGNSFYTMMIPPKHMVMSRGIKCSGDYLTKCRLRLKNGRDSLFSNEFTMRINSTQFEYPVEKDKY